MARGILADKLKPSDYLLIIHSLGSAAGPVEEEAAAVAAPFVFAADFVSTSVDKHLTTLHRNMTVPP